MPSDNKDDRIKVHSLGYMEEKLKRNLHNPVECYILTATTLIKVCGKYNPEIGTDTRKKEAYELILCSAGIERLIKNIESKIPPDHIIPQELSEARKIVSILHANSNSGLYHHLREYVEPQIKTINYTNRVRDLGKIIRDAVRQDETVGDEAKFYISNAEDIKLENITVRTIENEYKKIRKRIIGL